MEKLKCPVLGNSSEAGMPKLWEGIKALGSVIVGGDDCVSWYERQRATP